MAPRRQVTVEFDAACGSFRSDEREEVRLRTRRRSVVVDLNEISGEGREEGRSGYSRCQVTLRQVLSHVEATTTTKAVSVTRLGQRLDETAVVEGGDVLDVRGCVFLGGGGDGGSTGAEDRKAWLEMFLEKKPDKVDPNEVKKAKWTRCQISGVVLEPPIVADKLGNLYNKEAVVHALLKKQVPEGCGHIRSLKKDVLDLKLEKNPSEGRGDFDFQCPITGLEMNGRFRFYAILPSGHVVSHRAIKEAKECVEELVGGASVGEESLLPINGTEEEVKVLREKLSKREKRRKKKKKEEEDKGNNSNNNSKRQKLAVPAGANEDVYASIFTSSRKEDESKGETFLCRSNAARGMSLT